LKLDNHKERITWTIYAIIMISILFYLCCRNIYDCQIQIEFLKISVALPAFRNGASSALALYAQHIANSRPSIRFKMLRGFFFHLLVNQKPLFSKTRLTLVQSQITCISYFAEHFTSDKTTSYLQLNCTLHVSNSGIPRVFPRPGTKSVWASPSSSFVAA